VLGIRRRQFMALLGSAAAGWPLSASAQQATVPVIGFLSARSPGESASVEAAFRKGLSEAGHVEGRNVHIAFRWAEGQYDRLQSLTLANRLPSIGAREYAEAGGLIGYGVNIPNLYRRAAYFVDRILKGTKPADLPIEQPTKFELIVNLKTAKTLGLVISETFLVRADGVIE
jgi:hypothetical protein